MKPHTGITDKEKLHLMRQQLATQDRVIAELRKKRISAVCRAKAFQKHLKDAKRAKGRLEQDLQGAHEMLRLMNVSYKELGTESHNWRSQWHELRRQYVAETAAHASAVRAMDAMRADRDMWSDRYAVARGNIGALQFDMQKEISRGDRWQVYGLIVSCIAVGLVIALWVGLCWPARIYASSYAKQSVKVGRLR